MAYFDYIIAISVVIVLGFTIITMYRQLFLILLSNKDKKKNKRMASKKNGNR